MKYLKLISFIAFILVLSTSCSKSSDDSSDDDELTTIEKLRNSWKIDDRTINGTTDPLSDECDLFVFLSFSDDLSYKKTIRTGESCITSNQFTGTYSVDGDTYTTITAMGTIEHEILELFEERLTVRYQFEGDTWIEVYVRP